MGCVSVVITVSEDEARALLALVRTDLEKRICSTRDALLEPFRYRAGSPEEEALADYMRETFDLLECGQVGLYRRLVGVVPPIEEEAPADPAAADDAT